MDEMSVQVYGDLDRGMPHLLIDINRTLALLEQERGKGMAKVMEANLTQASGLEQAIKHAVAQIVGVEQAAGFATEHPWRGSFPPVGRYLQLPLRLQVTPCSPGYKNVHAQGDGFFTCGGGGARCGTVSEEGLGRHGASSMIYERLFYTVTTESATLIWECGL